MTYKSNKWIDACKEKELLRIKELCEKGEASAALELSSQRASLKADTPAAALLRSRCHAILGDQDLAALEHELACSMLIKKADAADLLELAGDAEQLELPGGYVAGLYELAAQKHAELGVQARCQAATLYNRAGIIRYRDGSDSEGELRAFELGHAILDGASELSEEEEWMLNLLKNNLAESVFSEGDSERAQELYSHAADYFEGKASLENKEAGEHYSISLRGLTEVLREKEDFMGAYHAISRLINSIEKLLKNEKKDNGENEIFLAVLGGCYNSRGTLRYRIGDYDGEVEDCTKSLELRKKIDGDDFGEATVYCNRAEAYEAVGNTAAAADDYITAIALFEKIDEPRARLACAERRYCLGRLLNSKKEYRRAQAYFEKAVSGLAELRATGVRIEGYSAEQLTDLEALCRYWLGLAASGGDDHDYYIGITELRKAIALLESLPNTEARSAQISSLRYSYGELLELFGEYDLSMQEYELSGGTRYISSEYFGDEMCDNGKKSENSGEIWEDINDSTPKA